MTKMAYVRLSVATAFLEFTWIHALGELVAAQRSVLYPLRRRHRHRDMDHRLFGLDVCIYTEVWIADRQKVTPDAIQKLIEMTSSDTVLHLKVINLVLTWDFLFSGVGGAFAPPFSTFLDGIPSSSLWKWVGHTLSEG